MIYPKMSGMYGTQRELDFISGIGGPGRNRIPYNSGLIKPKLDRLLDYQACLANRDRWERIDREQVLRHLNNEIILEKQRVSS